MDFYLDTNFSKIKGLPNSKILSYYEKTNNDIVKKAIDNKEDSSKIPVELSRYSDLYHVYEYLFANNHLDIIENIVSTPCDKDEMIVYGLAIQYNELHFLELLRSIGFDFDGELDYQVNPIAYAYSAGKGLDTIKFFEEINVDITKNVNKLLISACGSRDKEMIVYLFDKYKFDQKTLYGSLMTSIRINDWSRACQEKSIDFSICDMILNYLNLADYTYNPKDIVEINADTLYYLINHGLKLSIELLEHACIFKNIGLIDILLKEGITPNNKIIDIIFTNMSLESIKLLIKYKIDLSQYKHKIEHNEIVCDIESLGMDRNVLLDILIYNHFYKTSNFTLMERPFGYEYD